MSVAEKVEKSEAPEDASLEQSCDEIIAEHNGDARAAIRALLQKTAYLERARDCAIALVSYGYARGKLE